MGELKNRKRIGMALDNESVERLNTLSQQTGVTKSRLIDWAIFMLLDRYEKGENLKPENYFDSVEKDEL
ncbi:MULTISPECIES: ribbon-helix-helix domain-containing protein [Exiguobacterium]|uniref:ribbon-helix-helix domain-containing protein n=1 Tax=Exiguobacterium TaxID=33986 RepID=UPI001BEC2A54|nr:MULTISPECIES: ribbon-helix-helix domain-containing protein [Exiguobacterium]MCT4792855.1 ribbon-helix-helix domain-containing protein [Exiguobacterium artemiae]